MRENNIVKDKSYAFALMIIRLYKKLCSEKKEYILSKQFIRSGTAVGALIREAEFAQSKNDFINKMSIALKEANETDYWISILKDTDYLSIDDYNEAEPEIKSLIKLLVSIINTSKHNLNRK